MVSGYFFRKSSGNCFKNFSGIYPDLSIKINSRVHPEISAGILLKIPSENLFKISSETSSEFKRFFHEFQQGISSKVFHVVFNSSVKFFINRTEILSEILPKVSSRILLENP